MPNWKIQSPNLQWIILLAAKRIHNTIRQFRNPWFWQCSLVVDGNKIDKTPNSCNKHKCEDKEQVFLPGLTELRKETRIFSFINFKCRLMQQTDSSCSLVGLVV
jgi:hypothetical protein